MQKINYDTLVQAEEHDVHVVEYGKRKLSGIVVNKNYKYNLNAFEKVLSFLLRIIVLLVIPPLLFVKHGFVVRGRRNLRHIKKSGAVSISNHVLALDGPIVAQALFSKKLTFHSLEENFRIPVVRRLIKLLGTVPIPNSITARRQYVEHTHDILARGEVVHIYPEGSLWPYFDGIRKFKSGAFHFACRAGVPIVPVSINFRKPRGLEKLLPSKDTLVTVHIGKPIYPNANLQGKEQVSELLNRSHHTLDRMNKYFKLLDQQKIAQSEAIKEEMI